MTFFLIVLLAVLLRVSLLVYNQSHVDGDEAVIGLMAKHIYEKGIHPLYMYGQIRFGQTYGGGGVFIESHLASFIYPFTGAFPLALKSMALIFSLLALALSYWAVKRIYGRGNALLASLLFALSPATMIWNLKMRGGYLIVIILSITLFYLMVHIFYEKRQGRLPSFLLGFFSGLGLWSLELIFPLVCVIFLLWAAAWVRGKKERPIFVFFLIGFLLGYFPSLYSNLTHDFSNWMYLAGNKMGSRSIFFRVSEIPRAVFLDFPRSFAPEAEWHSESWNGTVTYREGIPVTCWMQYLIVLASFIFLHPKTKARSLLLTFFITFFVIYSIGRPSPHPIPRYFLALYPLLTVSVALFLSSTYRKGGVVRRLPSVSAVLFLSILGLYEHVDRIPREPVVYDAGVLTVSPRGMSKYYSSQGDSLRQAISILKAQGIKAAYAPYYLKYRLIFEAGEEVIASSRPFGGDPRDTGYNDQVEKAQRFAFVSYLGSPYDRVIRRLMDREGIVFDHRTLDGLSLYIPRDFLRTKHRVLKKLE